MNRWPQVVWMPSNILFVGGPFDGERRMVSDGVYAYEFRYAADEAGNRKAAVYELGVETEDGGEFHFVGMKDIPADKG